MLFCALRFTGSVFLHAGCRVPYSRRGMPHLGGGGHRALAPAARYALFDGHFGWMPYTASTSVARGFTMFAVGVSYSR